MDIKIQIIRIAYLIVILLCLQIAVNTNCRDPGDFEPPPPDSLLPPPAAPVLLYPPDSFVFMTDSHYIGIVMRWSAVDSAEKYILKFGADTLELDTNSWYAYDNIEFGPYLWRVRAASPRWTGGYTDWSETGFFDTRPRPGPPVLLEPLYDTIFYDSLPRGVRFAWIKVADARHYELELYRDTILVYYEMPATSECTLFVDAPGRYYWHVRTNDPHWQYNTDWSELGSFRISSLQ